MRVILGGDLKHPVLFATTQATSVLIETDDGKPTVLFLLDENRNGWIRLTKGEDKNFHEELKRLELT